MYYTSYFANVRHIDRTKYKLGTISASKPDFFNKDKDVLDLRFLGPNFALLTSYKKGEINEDVYARCYLQNLEAKWDSIKPFIEAHYNDNLVFLCYEKPPKFCHRHLLAEFLKLKGYKCEEL